MKEVLDKRRKAHYYLTILSLIIITIYFQQAMTSLDITKIIITYLKGILIIIIILFLTAAYERTKSKKRFDSIDLITKTIKNTLKPSVIIALIIILLNAISKLIPLKFLGITATEISLIIIGTIAGIIIYEITK